MSAPLVIPARQCGRTEGTWEAKGSSVVSPPQADVDAVISQKGWARQRIVCVCDRPEDAMFIALRANMPPVIHTGPSAESLETIASIARAMQTRSGVKAAIWAHEVESWAAGILRALGERGEHA